MPRCYMGTPKILTIDSNIYVIRHMFKQRSTITSLLKYNWVRMLKEYDVSYKLTQKWGHYRNHLASGESCPNSANMGMWKIQSSYVLLICLHQHIIPETPCTKTVSVGVLTWQLITSPSPACSIETYLKWPSNGENGIPASLIEAKWRIYALVI